MKKYLILLVVLLGGACAPILSPTPTTEPTPLPTPTPIPLSELNLDSILVAEGDLPEDLVPDLLVKENAVGSADELDRATAVFTQYFLLNGGEGGGVSVFLFESLGDVQAAFDKVSTFMESPTASDFVGEQARYEYFFYPTVPDVPAIQGSRLIFSRCHALAVVQFPRAEDLQSLAEYGQNLDGRLQPLVCDGS